MYARVILQLEAAYNNSGQQSQVHIMTVASLHRRSIVVAVERHDDFNKHTSTAGELSRIVSI